MHKEEYLLTWNDKNMYVLLKQFDLHNYKEILLKQE